MRYISVLVALIGVIPVIAGAKELPAVRAASRAPSVALGPSYPAPVDPELGALQAQLRAALSQGDRNRARAIDCQVQALLLSRQPRPETNLPPPKVSFVPPSGIPLVGSDVMIMDGRILATAADYLQDGTMWTVCSRDDSNAFVFKSTDHGEVWQFVVSLNWSFNITRLGLCVGEGDSGFVHIFVINPANDGDLYDLRFNRDGTNMQTVPVLAGPDTISDFSVCRDMNVSGYWLYAAASNEVRVAPPGTNCSFIRSTNYGKNWAVTDQFLNTTQPCLSMGAGRYLYFVLRATPWLYPGYTSRLVNTNYGTPGYWRAIDVAPDTFQVSDPVMGAAFTLPESSAVIWTVYSHNYHNSGDWDILYDYSTDAGLTWGSTGSIAYTSFTEINPDLKNYAAPGNTYMNASYISIDGSDYRTVYRHYVNASIPGSWSDTLRINSGSAGTGRAIRPLLVYSPGGPGSGAGCVFDGEGLTNFYWNAPWHTSGVAEGPFRNDAAAGLLIAPNPSRTATSISYSLSQAGNVRLELYDISGRLVTTLLTGYHKAGASSLTLYPSSLSSGIYLVKLTGPGRTAIRKLVIE